MIGRVVVLACLVPIVAVAQPSPGTALPVNEPSPPPVREGLTIEVSAGPSWIRTSPRVAPSFTSDISLAVNAGAGVWLTPRLALGGRFAGVSNFEGGERLGAYVIGPAVQFWVDDRVWVGAGAGLGVLMSSTSPTDVGFGFDLRAGWTFREKPESTLSLSVEITPARFSVGGDAATLTGIAFVLGFQTL